MTAQSLDEVRKVIEEARQLERSGNFGDALDLYIDALASRLSIRIQSVEQNEPYIDADIFLISRIAEIASMFQEQEAVDLLYKSLASIFEQSGNLQMAFLARIQRGYMQLQFCDFDSSESMLRDLCEQHRGLMELCQSTIEFERFESGYPYEDSSADDRDVIYARLYLFIGSCLASDGKFLPSIEILKRAKHLSSPGSPPLAFAVYRSACLALASSLLEYGDLAGAKLELQQIVNLVQSDKSLFIRWLELDGKHCLLSGDLGQGKRRFSEVLEQCELIAAPRSQINAAFNLVEILTQLNQITSAEELLEKMSSLGLASEPVFSERLKIMRSLIELRLEGTHGREINLESHSRSKSKAESLNYSLLQTKTSGSFLSFFEDRAFAFQYHLAQENLEAAKESYKTISQLFSPSDSKFIAIRLKVMSATLQYYETLSQENLTSESSLQCLREAEALFESAYSEFVEIGCAGREVWQVMRALDWSRRRRGVIDEELHSKADKLLEQNELSLDPAERSMFMLNVWMREEETLALEVRKAETLQKALKESSQIRKPIARLQLWIHLNELLNRIDRHKDALAKKVASGKQRSAKHYAISLWQRILLHSRDRVTLSFLVLPTFVLIVRSGFLRLDFHIVPTSRIMIRQLVRSWHRIVSGVMRDVYDEEDSADDSGSFVDVDGQSTLSKELSEALGFEYALSELPDSITGITIVPDDLLHGFPFAAMRLGAGSGNGRTTEYLIERYRLNIGFESFSQSKKPTKSGIHALVAGRSEYPPLLRNLPGVETELKDLQAYWTTLKVHTITALNSESQKELVLSALTKCFCAHVACHGKFSREAPDQSGLVLSGSDGGISILTLQEISALTLTNLRHVTLTSCWSADHYILPGRWIISIPETLSRAGVQSVLGSLWGVYDDIAAQFVKRFYQYLLNHDRDEALRKTQIDFIQNNGIVSATCLDPSDPMIWAGFVLYGEYRKFDVALCQCPVPIRRLSEQQFA